MAIRIVSPRSTIIDVPSPEILVKWEDSTDGQEAYELQYKFKKNNVWSTCGKVYDTNARSTSLNAIYNLTGVDFYEVHYRIVIYYNGPNDKGYVQGIETSDAYSIIFRHSIVNTLKLYDGNNTIMYPLYDQIAIDRSKSGNEVEVVNISLDDTGSTINKLPLVEEDNPIKSDFNIFISDTDTKRVAGSYAAFTDTGIYGETYMNQNTYYQEIVYDYNYQDVYESYALYRPIEYYNYTEDYSYQNVYHNITLYDYAPDTRTGEDTDDYPVYGIIPEYSYWPHYYRYESGIEYYTRYNSSGDPMYFYWYTVWSYAIDHYYEYIPGYTSYIDHYYTYYYFYTYSTGVYEYTYYNSIFDYRYSYVSGYIPYVDGYTYYISGYESYYDYTYTYNYVVYEYIYNYYYLYYNS